jgi:hypothetical protein
MNFGRPLSAWHSTVTRAHRGRRDRGWMTASDMSVVLLEPDGYAPHGKLAEARVAGDGVIE